jgi:hypothetical protein
LEFQVHELEFQSFFLFRYVNKMSKASWHLDDPVSVKGVRHAMLTTNRGTAQHSGSECCVEIPPDFSKEGRQEIHLKFIDSDLADWCYEFDQWALNYLVSHSLRLFKQPLSLMDIKARYCTITDRTYPREPCMLASIDLKTVAYYDQSGVTMAPMDLDQLEVTPVFEVKSMWFADTGTCGLTLDVVEVWV